MSNQIFAFLLDFYNCTRIQWKKRIMTRLFAGYLLYIVGYTVIKRQGYNMSKVTLIRDDT